MECVKALGFSPGKIAVAMDVVMVMVIVAVLVMRFGSMGGKRGVCVLLVQDWSRKRHTI